MTRSPIELSWTAKNQKLKKLLVAHAIHREHFLVTMLLRLLCCCYAVAMRSLCGCYAVALLLLLLQCCCYAAAMLMLCGCYAAPAVAVLLLCGCYAVAIQLLCCYYAVAMWLLCCYLFHHFCRTFSPSLCKIEMHFLKKKS